MAYMSQERKQQLAPAIKAILKKHGIKGTLAVRHHSTLVLNITEGKIDFIGSYGTESQGKGYIQVNEYYLDRDYKEPEAKILTELRDAMMTGNHNNSDAMTDYFDVGWYIDINIGAWDKPYKLI